jgi:DNA-binding NtrC family response regulator
MPAYQKLNILSISPATEDHNALRRIVAGLPWQVSGVATCREAIERLHSEGVPLIVCEKLLEDGTWKDILNHIKGSTEVPLLIVASRMADAFLWAEVLNLGGYDVLAKPFSDREVRHVLTTAVLSGLDATSRTHGARAD